MDFFDIHSHHPSREGERVLLQGRDSWGIHPWKIPDNWRELCPPEGILAIGESGLDKLCSTPYALQEEVFRSQIQFSEERHLPLIIHCVKAIDDLLALKREIHPHEPWIFHGFRGKPQQLRSLLDAGFYISFGFRFCEESLLMCPMDRLLMETDEDSRPVRLLYEKVAALRGPLSIPISDILPNL